MIIKTFEFIKWEILVKRAIENELLKHRLCKWEVLTLFLWELLQDFKYPTSYMGISLARKHCI
jgi:hypothetical protein